MIQNLYSCLRRNVCFCFCLSGEVGFEQDFVGIACHGPSVHARVCYRGASGPGIGIGIGIGISALYLLLL